MPSITGSPRQEPYNAETMPVEWNFHGINIALRTDRTLRRVAAKISREEDRVEEYTFWALHRIFAKGIARQLRSPSTLIDPECCICRDPLDEIKDKKPHDQHNPAETHCGHVFGYSCLFIWWSTYDKIPTCPICRVPSMGPISEEELLEPVYKRAFHEMEESSNRWGIDDLKVEDDSSDYIDLESDRWIQELTEIYAALLWAPYLHNRTYELNLQKARVLAMLLETKREIYQYGREEAPIINHELAAKYEAIEELMLLVPADQELDLVVVPLLRELSCQIYKYQRSRQWWEERKANADRLKAWGVEWPKITEWHKKSNAEGRPPTGGMKKKKRIRTRS